MQRIVVYSRPCKLWLFLLVNLILIKMENHMYCLLSVSFPKTYWAIRWSSCVVSILQLQWLVIVLLFHRLPTASQCQQKKSKGNLIQHHLSCTIGWVTLLQLAHIQIKWMSFKFASVVTVTKWLAFPCRMKWWRMNKSLQKSLSLTSAIWPPHRAHLDE